MSQRKQAFAVVSLALALLAGSARADSIELITRVPPGLESASASGSSTTYFMDFLQPRQRPPAGNTVSSDGRYVAFTSSGRNLTSGPIEIAQTVDVFVHDRVAGTTVLVSRSAAGGGATGNNGSLDPVISADGRYIAFLSYATDLVPGQVDSNNGTDVFLFDRQTGTMTLVSREAGTTATTANEPSNLPVLSADGSSITFTSTATNLVAGGGGSEQLQVYLFDRSAGTNLLVSHAAGAPATPGNGESLEPVLSADGRFVAYVSTATDLVTGQSDGNTVSDVFLYDRLADVTALVSRTSGSATTASSGTEPVISADGSHVAFASSGADLVAGQSGEANNNIFLYRRSDGLVTLVSHAAAGGQQGGNGFSRAPAISADGSSVAFVSFATDLIDPYGGSSTYAEIFLFERAAGTVTLISPLTGTGSSGFPTISADGGEVVFFTFDGTYLYSREAGSLTLVSRTLHSPSENAGANGHFLSADGNVVVFASRSSNLVEADWNEREDVFLFSRSTGTNTLVSRADPGHLSRTSAWGATRASISNDGNHVAFLSEARDLVPGQVESDADLDVFAWSRLTGQITRLSQEEHSNPQDEVYRATISGDGAWILFNGRSGEDTPALYDRALFLSHRATGETLLVTHQANAPTTPAEGSVDFLEEGAISGDGRFIAYRGAYSNLVPGQSGGTGSQVYLYDRVTATTSLVSHAAGSPTTTANGLAHPSVSISADGRFVVFASSASDLVAGQSDTNFAGDVFLYDRSTGEVTLVSRKSGFPATAGDGESALPKISADGRWIVFLSDATDLVAGQIDDNEVRDIFLHDRLTGTTVLVTHALGAATTAAQVGGSDPTISADGRFVAFASGSNDLTVGSSDSCPMFTSCLDIYLYDRTTGENAMVSHSAASLTASGGRQATDPRITANGRFVVFASDSNDHVPGLTDFQNSRDLFLYDRTTGALSILSRRDDAPTVAATGFYATPNADGSRIVLETPSAYQDGDLNATLDLYLYSKDFAGADLFTLPPCRLFDTRRPEDGPALVTGKPVLLTIDGGCGIPPTAQSLVLNVTVFEPAGRGNLSLFPGDSSGTGTSTINFQPGLNRANNAIVRLSFDGSGSLGVLPLVTHGGTVHVILDVVGYFE